MSDFRPRTDLVMREVDGEMVILDQEMNLIHTLNPTARLVWDALQRNESVSDIAEFLVESFDVDSAKAITDIDAVLGKFLDLGLLQSTARSGGPNG